MMHRICVLTIAILTIGLVVGAAEITDEQAIEFARDGLNRASNFPWYDSDNDTANPVDLGETEQPFQPNDWELKQKKRRPPAFNFPAIWPALQRFAWVFLALVFVLLGYLAFRSFFGLQSTQDDLDEEFDEVERIAQLPYPIRKPSQDLLEEAKYLYENGRYSEAIVYLFSHQLIQLDKAHLIHLTKGKTNRQYLSEIQQLTALPKIVAETMLAFEDVFFGQHDISKERFESCWFRLSDFSSHLEKANA